MSEKLDKQYLRIAQILSENSHAKRLKVGAIIVKDRTIISDGFNGTPSGFDNECEFIEGGTKPWVLHAEANAITKVAQSNSSSKGATIYTLISPCLDCSKLIIQSGIIRVVYHKDYRLDSGLKLLSEANIEIVKIENLNPIDYVQNS